MYIPNTKQLLTFGGAIVLATPLLVSPAIANDDHHRSRVRTVNCNDEDASIQKTVDSVRHGRKATIFVQGQCHEDVLIEKDDITLSGNHDGDGTVDGGVTGTITIVGARRVTIEYLHITGPNQGIRALDGATVSILHNEIVDNVGDGVAAFNNVLLAVNFNIITGNGRREEFEAGIDAGHNSTVRSRGNYIAENDYAAVEVGNAIHWRSEGGDVILEKGCSLGQPFGSCGVDDTFAVDCFRNASCHVRDAVITGDIFLSGFTYLDVTNTTIDAYVRVSTGSGVRFRGGVSGTGFVDCFGGRGVAFQNATCDAEVPPAP